MSQVFFTPNGIYKYFRQLVQGYTGSGVEPDLFYVDQGVGTSAVKQLKYFKVGVGGPVGDLTREFYDANCLNKESGKGGLAVPIRIFGNPADGYGGDAFKKALVPANFTQYGESVDSKVIGTLSVVTDNNPAYWNVPGIMFMVSAQLYQSEGNFDEDENPVVSPAVVEINEIGIFDEDDIMVLYGVFQPLAKNETLSLKVNSIAMQKILDYQLSFTPDTP